MKAAALADVTATKPCWRTPYAGQRSGRYGLALIRLMSAQGARGFRLMSPQVFGDSPTFSCRIRDDYIDSKRYPLFMARAALQELIESLQ